MANVDVLIVTSTIAEFEAVREVAERLTYVDEFGNVSTIRPLVRTGYDLTKAGRPLGKDFLIAIAHPTGAPSEIAAHLVDTLRPSLLAICGVCAGNPAHTDNGDVIIADSLSFFPGDSSPALRISKEQFDLAGTLQPHDLPSFAKVSLNDRLDALFRRIYSEVSVQYPTFEPRLTEAFRSEIEELIARGLLERNGGGVRLTERGLRRAEQLPTQHHSELERMPFEIRVGPIVSAVRTEPASPRKEPAFGFDIDSATIATAIQHIQDCTWIAVKGVEGRVGFMVDHRFRKFAARAASEVLFKYLKAAYSLLPTTNQLRSDDTDPPRHQSVAPIVVEMRNGRIAKVSDADTALLSEERDFDEWCVTLLRHIGELCAGDFRQGTNHARMRDRLLALDRYLTGTVSDVKAQQFRIGYEVERLGGLIRAYRIGPHDMPTLSAEVLEDVDRLHLMLKLGRSKFSRWEEFSRQAAADPSGLGTTTPIAVIEALEDVATRTEAEPKYFDPEIPASFRAVAEAVRDPIGATKAMIYGAVKSIENLIVFLGQKALGLGRSTIEAVQGGISKSVATALTLGLGTAALQLSGALPQGWAWIKPLLEKLAQGLG